MKNLKNVLITGATGGFGTGTIEATTSQKTYTIKFQEEAVKLALKSGNTIITIMQLWKTSLSLSNRNWFTTSSTRHEKKAKQDIFEYVEA